MFAEHRQEGGKERDGESSEEDRLNLNHRTGWAGPLWEGGNVVSEGGVVRLVDENTKEGGSLVIGIGLELRVELDDKSGGDRREQTSLCPLLAPVGKTRWKTHENQGCVQVFIMLLEEILVILLGNLAVVLVEPSPMIHLSRH